MITLSVACSGGGGDPPLDGGDTSVVVDSAVIDGAVIDGAMVDGATVDGATVDGAVIDGAMVDGNVIDSARADGAAVDGSDSAMADSGLSPTLYVDRTNPAADDANPGTESLPFETISQAAAVAQAGDVVLVKAGTYVEEVVIAHSGTPQNPIVFEAQQNVIVSPPSIVNSRAGLAVRGRTDIIIRGFSVRNAYFGIAVELANNTPAERVRVEKNYVTRTSSSGIRVFRSSDITVEGNRVEKTNDGGIHEMISIIGSDTFLVQNNEVWNGVWTANGSPVEGKEGIDAKEGSTNGAIIGNHVHHLTRLGIYVDSYSQPTGNIEVRDNIVHHCAHGVAISSEAGGELSTVLVANNIVYENRAHGIVVSSWDQNGLRKDISLLNNTGYANGGNGINIGTTQVQGLWIRNNIMAGAGGAKFRADDPSVITASAANLAWNGTAGNFTVGVTSGDPHFLAPATGNFGLGTGSAALDTGVTVAEVAFDALGTPRPQGSAYDIGAIEQIQ